MQTNTATVTDLLTAYAGGELTPSEVVESVFTQIADANPVINAHWHVLHETAAAAAAESTARWRSRSAAPRPLEGVPVGIKDVIDVAGAPCTGGSRLYRNRSATNDATVVRRLRAAGAVIVTKDATTEFGVGGPLNPLFGPTRNPWSPEHWTGGSSCGAAAGLAAGTIPLAVGTDAGGSVRIPAAWSGVVGLKPTMGRVSRAGVMPCSWHAEVVGPMSRTVSDALTLLQVISGHDPADQRTIAGRSIERDLEDPPPTALRIGIAPEWWADLTDEPTTQALERAVEALRTTGAQIVPVSGLPAARELHDLSYEIVWAEAWATHGAHAEHHHLMDPVGVGRLAAGQEVTAAEYFRILQRRADAQRRVFAALEPVDVLLTPTTATSAPRLDDLNLAIGGNSLPVHKGYGLLTAHANLTGFPALAVPAGFTSTGLPLSVQFTARPWDEIACCRAGRAFERAAGRPQATPDLSRAPGIATGSPDDVTGSGPSWTPYLEGELDPGGVDAFLATCP
ncbi:amidase [Pseudonocardia yuanmonensis]|uniref:Amidase n=2 Tax=Pseudonocardia yuanmonensis TaxID=1095914 RepID=A0ABP8XHG8_9PSEU